MRIDNKLCKPIAISIEKLHPFEGHPYKVLDDEEMETLADSIHTEGILSPLIVRPLEGTDGYEKAFAYKLKMEAMSHQGTSCQVGTKSRTDEMIGESTQESARQVQRYIRLTYLIPELLQLVDDGKIALTPAVELSYLPEKAQTYLLEEMRRNDCTPSLSQAIRLKKLYQTGSLSPEDISTIIQEEKANQQEKVSFKTGDLRKFFPKSYSAAQMQETILKLLSEYQRKRQRAAER